MTRSLTVPIFGLILSLTFPALSPAQAPPEDNIPAAAPASEEPFALDSLEVVGEGFTYEQEVTLRLLRDALDKPKRLTEDARDDWVCWIDEATGSKFNYLNCARNGDLWALQPSSLGSGGSAIGAPLPVAGYGKILRSTHPVNTWKLKQAMASLEGNAEFDQEFIALALTGERPPRDVPSEEELDQFARAYQVVGRLQARGVSERRQISAIEAQGLSLARYNRIAELTEVYQSLENAVAERLGSSDS